MFSLASSRSLGRLFRQAGGAKAIVNNGENVITHTLAAASGGSCSSQQRLPAARPQGLALALPAAALATWWRSPIAGHGCTGLIGLALGSVRGKQTKRQAYHKDARASPCGQRMPNRAHLGEKAVSAEYVEVGRLIVKQRKFIARNPNVTRSKHFKIYPGINVRVLKSTSLVATVSGRIKMTHDVTRDVKIINVLPEPREELLEQDLWRYRTEHVQCMQENQHVCHLRTKALPVFGKDGGWINQTTGPKPMRVRISGRNDHWNNPNVQDPLDIEPFAYPMPRHVLARHIRKVRRKQAGLPDEDPGLEVTDSRFHLFKGQSAQR
mmetsp:Transcript_96010/g.151207  ORF Transcript_96010/g.151207 Transcript_96010/m.151207 type:complete len:323 (+) Transcript_96010:54-1022(+)